MFTIRKGFRFSDGKPVTAKNYAYAINRAFDPDLWSDAFYLMADEQGTNIVGAEDVRKERTHNASGVRVRGNKLVIRLKQPDGTFLAKISMPFFQALPLSLSREQSVVEVDGDLPAAGPYFVSKRERDRLVVLRRNPFYAQDVAETYRRRPRRLSSIVIRTQTSADTSYEEVRSNRADFVYSLPPDAARKLAQEFGLSGRFRVRPTNCIGYIALNSNNRLFRNNPKLRRAVNYVIDRKAMAGFGGKYTALPTDQYLPAGFPGFENIEAYPFSPNMQKARELARGNVPSGGPWIYSYYLDRPGAERMELMRRQLASIGIEIAPQGFRGFPVYDYAANRSSPHAFAARQWCADYPDPHGSINTLFYGRSIQERDNRNLAYFDNPAFDDRMERAARLTGAARLRAYERLEHDLVRKGAPWAAWGQPARQFFFSPSVDTKSFVYQSIYEAPSYNLLALK